MRLSRWAVVGAVALSGAAAAGCGASASAENHLSGRRLTVYASVPFQGSSAVAARGIVGGIEMALDRAHHRVGRYRIVLRVLDDATTQRGGWDPGQTSANARRAMADHSAIGYIGDVDSGASAVSIPLLNRAGIPQISPASTAVGLTMSGSGASPGEPQKYYPAQRRTFVRVVPNDAVQAAAQVRVQLQAGCRRTIVLQDGEVDGQDAAMSFSAAAQGTALRVIATDQFAPAANAASVAAAVARAGAGCVLITGLDDHRAALLSERVAAAAPAAELFGWSSLAAPAFTNAADGGIDGWLTPRLLVTAAGLGAFLYPPAGRRVEADYARHYGRFEPSAIYGYEAMSLLLDAVGQATDSGRDEVDRSVVMRALLHTRDRHSVLGTYSIDSRGDTSLHRYGVYRVSGGRLVFWRAVAG